MVPETQGILQLPVPARIVARPINARERHAHDFRIAAGRPGPQKRLRERRVTPHRAFTQTAGGLIREKAPCQLRVPVIPGVRCIDHAAVTFEQLDHGPVMRAVRPPHRSPRGANLPVGIRATREQHLRHRELGSTSAEMQRQAPRVRDLLSIFQTHALIRVEAKLQQQRQRLRPIVLHRDRKQAAKRAEDIEGRRIDQRAFSVTRPHPVQVTQGGCGNGRQLGAPAQQHLRHGRESLRTVALVP